MPTTGTRPAVHDRERLLRSALLVNAGFSASSGVVLVAGAATFDAMFGVHAAVLAVLGTGLLAFAASIAVAVRARRLATVGRTAIAADVAWVAGAAGVVAADLLTATGVVALGAVTVVVAALAIAQWLGLRRLPER